MARHVEIDAQSFPQVFARRSLAVMHNLSGHPLFTMEAMAELADRLPAQSVRREQADLALANSGFGYVDVGSGPPSETLLDIENSGVRMTLRDIQQDPAYAEIINGCLDEVEGLVETGRAG